MEDLDSGLSDNHITEQDLYDFLGRGCRTQAISDYIKTQRHQHGSWIKAWFDKLAWRSANIDKIDWLKIALAPDMSNDD